MLRINDVAPDFVAETSQGTIRFHEWEILGVIDSLQLTARHQVSTPANWRPGGDVIISGSVSDEEARKKYPSGWKAPRPYLRMIPQPN